MVRCRLPLKRVLLKAKKFRKGEIQKKKFDPTPRGKDKNIPVKSLSRKAA
jgi:hypothetical protein